MILGIGLGEIDFAKVRQYRFFSTYTILAKFMVWPSAIYLVSLLDLNFLGVFGEETWTHLRLISFLPMAVNSVVLASITKNDPQSAAWATFLTTVLSMGIIPLAAIFLLS